MLLQPETSAESGVQEPTKSSLLPIKMISGDKRDQWIELITDSPREEFFDNNDPLRVIKFDQAKARFYTSNDFWSAYAFGHLQIDSFRLQLKMSRDFWAGSSGVFWGGRWENDIFHCQELVVEPIRPLGQNPKLRLTRRLVRMVRQNEGQRPIPAHWKWKSVEIETNPEREGTIDVIVLKGQVHSIRFNEKRYNDLCDGGRWIVPISPQDSPPEGIVGVCNSEGSTVYEALKVCVPN